MTSWLVQQLLGCLLKASHRQATEGQGRLGVAGTQRRAWAWRAPEIANAQNVGCASDATCPEGPVMCGVCGACLKDASRSLIPAAILAPGVTAASSRQPPPPPLPRGFCAQQVCFLIAPFILCWKPLESDRHFAAPSWLCLCLFSFRGLPYEFCQVAQMLSSESWPLKRVSQVRMTPVTGRTGARGY